VSTDLCSELEEAAGTGTACAFLHDYFTRAARRWPDRVAVEVPPGSGRPARARTTYAELEARSDALAARLAPHLCGEHVIGVLLARDSANLYAAQLAILKAGGAYVCLDPVLPAGRMRDILEDAGVEVLITDAQGAARATREGFAPPLTMEMGDAGHPGEAGRAAGAPWLTPDSLAYLIYTSGTTGRPKGVMIEHRAIVNLIESNIHAFRLSPEDRVAQNSSPAYDASIEETLLALAVGATVVVMDDEAVRLGPDIIEWLRRERISVFCPPPTLLRAASCDDPRAALPDLKLLYAGGEALPQDLAERWSVGHELVNSYGPTECAVTCTRERVEPGAEVGIGWPVPGAQAWVMDEHLQPVPDGERGELVIGGVGLARGYWRRPELTADRFPLVAGLGRVYRTGDLAHRDTTGRLFYHGRIDAQVKIRGHRVELGDIESHLARCPGVRAAVCRLQDDAGHSTLVAFVVPADSARPPAFQDLVLALGQALPPHMVPTRFGILTELPTLVSGKLDRKRLPHLEPQERVEATGARARVLPRTALEEVLHAAVVETLDDASASIHDDFFDDLGGDSLRAAELISRLRDHGATAWVTVRDVYEARTVARLAERTPADARQHAAQRATPADRPRQYPVLVTLAQAAWLVGTGVVAATVGWGVLFVALPWLLAGIGLMPFLVLAPLLGIASFAIYTPLSVLFAVVVKRVLIGRYRAMRAAVWSGFYLRHWIVQDAARFVPWRALEGTVFQQSALRALGARIGARVHIHRQVDLVRGGWDLLEIGDDVTLSQGAMVRVVDLAGGDMVVGPVTLHAGATLDIRAGVAPGGVLEEGAYLTALSSLPPGGRIPAGERWDGIPAAPAGQAPVPPALPADTRVLTARAHGAVTFAAQSLLGLALALPTQALALAALVTSGFGPDELWALMAQPATTWTPWIMVLALVTASGPLTLAWSAVLTRLLGSVSPGVMSRWSPAYVRVWLKTGLLARAGNWLSGTLFWPLWLRAAGMEVGHGCEVGTIIDVVPELVAVGPESFFADGIYLGGPRVQRGTVTLARTRLGTNTFLGNHAVVFAGQSLPDEILLGVCTAADDGLIRKGSDWFGHPPFELPRREVVNVDRALTHDPSFVRYWNRVCWEVLRFALPIVPFLVLVGWTRAVSAADDGVRFLVVTLPLVTFAAAATPVALVLALKWALLGRVRPGQHPLWSCWCSRWDFLFVVWAQQARPLLRRLEGTLLLSGYLRALGMRIGRRVVLGPGFSQVVDPDMIAIGDEATVSATFQAHTFEDRVLKIDRVMIGEGATMGAGTVPLYGAVVGAAAFVAPHSVVMKRERLLPRVRYEGAPTRPQGPAHG
jgi:non-ribosomal peptide synthetase-like protein